MFNISHRPWRTPGSSMLGTNFVLRTRRSWIAGSALLVTACTGERATSPESARVLPVFSGNMSASITFTRPDGTKQFYHSSKVPYRTAIENGKVVIPAATVGKLGKSMVQIPLIGTLPLSPFFATNDMATAFHFASSVDPETDLDNFSVANPVSQQSEDVFLAAPDWAMMTSDSYTEQISDDGTTAYISLDPISETNPYGQARLYLNGVLVATVNPQYESAYDGMHDYQNGGATYSYYTGAQTTTGTRTTEGGQWEPTLWSPDQSELLRFHQPQFAALLNAFLPKMAYAQQRENCYYYMRGVLIGLAGMYFAGRRGYVEGFITSWIGVVNSIHQFARCKERNSH
jgi:hypothetical protein